MDDGTQILRSAGEALRRNRVRVMDLGFILIVLAAAALFAFEVDIFETEGAASLASETFELDELMLLSTLLMAGALAYTWRRAREHKRENLRRIEAEKEVLSLAMQDPLTGLPNRRQFDAVLKSALQSIPSYPEAHAVFLLDLNGFKKINDVHGHPVGDQLLIQVSARLMRAARDGDLVARLGGDEFAVIARNVAGAEGATSIARRIIDSFSSPFMINGAPHTVGTAIGVSLAPHNDTTAEELVRKADVALYRAKAEKKSAVRFFESEMDARLYERDALERALLDGLETDAFFVRFKPAARMQDGVITSFEALPRWLHPTMGELEPERFLAIAEDAGQLSALTEQLLTKACAAAIAWPSSVRLAFNLPGSLLTDSTIGLKLLSVLGRMNLSPRRLDIEIDEGALVREADAAQRLLKGLRGAGVSVVADNFGTGYSNLQNLHDLGLDRIKIDASFVSAMEKDSRSAAMIKALIGIGIGLNIPVVVDGVASVTQQATLASQGCGDVQGDLIGGSVDAIGAMRLVGMQPRLASAN